MFVFFFSNINKFSRSNRVYNTTHAYDPLVPAHILTSMEHSVNYSVVNAWNSLLA